jgi:hypothetical protein
MGTSPGYEQIRFDPEEKEEQAQASGWADGRCRTARINQAAQVFVAELVEGINMPYFTGL